MSRHGTTLWGLKVAAEKHPVGLRMIRPKEDEGRESMFPFIASTRSKHHFVLALARKGKDVLIFEPGSGEILERPWKEWVSDLESLALHVGEETGDRPMGETPLGHGAAILRVVGDCLVLVGLLGFASKVVKRRVATAMILGIVALSYEAAASPSIAFDAAKHDCGTVGQCEQILYTVPFRNAGTDTLKITELKSSCTCTALDLEKKSYAPGEKGEISIKYDSGDRRGALKTYLFVKSNDPKTPKALLELSALVVPIFEVAPTRITFPRQVVGSEAMTKYLMIRSKEGLKCNGVSTEKGLFIVEAVRDEENAWPESVRVAIRIAKTNKPGILSDDINLELLEGNGKTRTLRIPVRVTVGDEPVLAGSRGAFGLVKPGRKYDEAIPMYFSKPVDKVTVKSVKGKGLKAEIEVVSPTYCLLSVSLADLGHEDEGIYAGEVLLQVERAGKKGKTITVTISAWCE